MAILVVDDDDFAVQVLVLYIQNQLKQTVINVPTGKEAFEQILAQEFELIVLDIHLPDMSGFEILKKVRKIRSPLELPIMLVTTASDSQEVVKSFNLGANEYITKPLEPQIVMVRIQNLLNTRREFLLAKEEAGKILASGNRESKAPVRHDKTVILEDSEKSFDSFFAGEEQGADNTPSKTEPVELPAIMPVPEMLPGPEEGGPSRASAEFDLLNAAEGPMADVSMSISEPIPCEIPVIVAVDSRNYFCKTIKISLNSLLVLAFDHIPDAPSYKIELPHPKGDTVALETRAEERTAIEDRKIGKDKIRFKIIGASRVLSQFLFPVTPRLQGSRSFRSQVGSEGAFR